MMLTQIRFNKRLDNDISNVISRDSDSHRLCGRKCNAGGPKEVIYNKYFCDFQSNGGAKLHVMSGLFPICRPYTCSTGWPWRRDCSQKRTISLTQWWVGMTRCVQKHARLQMVMCESMRDKKVNSETYSELWLCVCAGPRSFVVISAYFLSVLQLPIPSILSTSPHLHDSFQLSLPLSFLQTFLVCLVV